MLDSLQEEHSIGQNIAIYPPPWTKINWGNVAPYAAPLVY